MSDLNFEQLLAEHNQAYKDAEEFGNDWMPEDGKGYMVMLTKCTKGVSTKGDAPVGWWKVTGNIEDPSDTEQHGKEFCVGFFRTSVLGIVKGAARVLNLGTVVEDLEEVDHILQNCPGTLVKVDIRTTKSKKDGNDYTNAYLTDVIPMEDVVDETSAEPVDTGGEDSA